MSVTYQHELEPQTPKKKIENAVAIMAESASQVVHFTSI